MASDNLRHDAHMWWQEPEACVPDIKTQHEAIHQASKNAALGGKSQTV